jgi:hypothetical protein
LMHSIGGRGITKFEAKSMTVSDVLYLVEIQIAIEFHFPLVRSTFRACPRR